MLQSFVFCQSGYKLLSYTNTTIRYGVKTGLFFAEETLYYPYCDCEDRSILFSRLVRDLLGLDVILVFYPGHLATAVDFKIPVDGDYIELDGKHFTICDPTYIGAPIGATMPDMNNQTAKVILLK